ncbi:MauE/DoxX family redox-associated membrane protein [Desulfocurvus vexinensis]|uniref:MauE/DoxX family redox-associated membrane protein n=1 Tax=Desulfocurvus vexinensis TaxID=399548 RepID=UPI0004BC758E|nr:MauE/DoxX family redox-associated membrane protein [Desulfocurvus vexinensis]
MSAFFTTLRVLFGLTFLAAAVSKAAYPVEFAAIVANYQLLPEALVNPVALLLPWVEIACGAALVAGVWTRGAALVLCTLLVVFLAALGVSVMRGLDVQCGCFTVAPQAGASMRADMIRDGVILAVGLLVLGRAIWEERRRRASLRFWNVFTRPPASAFGEPAVQNGVLVVGDAPQADPRPAEPAPVFAAPEAAPALALEMPDAPEQEEGQGQPEAPAQPEPGADPQPVAVAQPAPATQPAASAENDEDDEAARKF